MGRRGGTRLRNRGLRHGPKAEMLRVKGVRSQPDLVVLIILENDSLDGISQVRKCAYSRPRWTEVLFVHSHITTGRPSGPFTGCRHRVTFIRSGTACTRTRTARRSWRRRSRRRFSTWDCSGRAAQACRPRGWRTVFRTTAAGGRPSSIADCRWPVHAPAPLTKQARASRPGPARPPLEGSDHPPWFTRYRTDPAPSPCPTPPRSRTRTSSAHRRWHRLPRWPAAGSSSRTRDPRGFRSI